MLVSTGWLASHLQDPNLVILHVGGADDYAAGHIPGARRLSLADISVSSAGGLRLEMPPREQLQAALGRAGIANDSRIVVYPANESVQSATRVWFTLDYAGFGANASLLDGGLLRWKAEGRPLSAEIPSVAQTRPDLKLSPDLVVNADWIRSRLEDPKVALLDARAGEFFTGANAGQLPRAGHIPGAINIPFNSLLDERFMLRSPEQLRARLPAAKAAVVYCHIGLQATVVYFAARMLGVEVRLYDGSFQDWSHRIEMPVATLR